MQVWFYILMFILGAAFGSFLCCQARRLRRKELRQKPLGKWSVCEKCGRRLRWWENLPIISWLILRGKCARCGTKIGKLEILAEISTAIMFLLLTTTIDISTASILEWGIFLTAILFNLVLAFLAFYDGAWGELPTSYLIVALIFAAVLAALQQPSVLNLISAIAILGGLYLLLYILSKGKWVGDGDWLLAAAIGAALGTPWLSLIALFVANFTACLVMGPIALRRKNSKVYFGPFLVIAFIIVYTFSDFLTNLL